MGGAGGLESGEACGVIRGIVRWAQWVSSKSRRVGVIGGATRGAGVRCWMGEYRADDGGRCTLGGVVGVGAGSVITGTLGRSSGMMWVVGSALYMAADCWKMCWRLLRA